jgi:hypothetical protein
VTALFEPVDYPATPAPHACAGSVCQVCELTRTSEQAKRVGTSKAKKDAAWWDQAARWIGQQPLGRRFTADDLIDAVGLPHGSPNQVGAQIRTWAVQDKTEPVGYAEAKRHSSHGRVLRVWQVIA